MYLNVVLKKNEMYQTVSGVLFEIKIIHRNFIAQLSYSHLFICTDVKVIFLLITKALKSLPMWNLAKSGITTVFDGRTLMQILWKWD